MKTTILHIFIFLSSFSLAMAQGKGTGEKPKKDDYKLMLGVAVKDHLSHEKVPNLRGELLMAADSSFVDTVEVRSMDDMVGVIFRIRKAGDYLLRLDAEGYVTTYVPVSLPRLHKGERQRMLPNAYMRRLPKKKDMGLGENDIELDEVVVKATKLKFYMDGDTLVYDADAFPMAEGSMLGDLIRQLPGVELEDGGVIKVNGRQVDAILLNGKDFFNSDRELLLENMPSYMVKSFNAYERAPEEVRGMKWEKSRPKEFVMDVRLKKEYSIGWIANAEAGGGSTFFDNAEGKKDAKYLGRLFGLRFTKNSRLVAFLNANNLNDDRNPGEEGDWAQLTQSNGLTRRIKGGTNFNIAPDYSKVKYHSYEGSLDASYSEKDNSNHTSSATFLDNGNTFGKSFYSKFSYDYSLNSKHRYSYHNMESIKDLIKFLRFQISPDLAYMKWNNRTRSASATLEEDVAHRLGKQWMDSIMAPNAGTLLKQYAINRTRSSTRGIGHWLNTGAYTNVSFCPAYNDYLRFSLYVSGRVTDRCEDNYEHYTLDYPRERDKATDYRNRFNPMRDKTGNFTIEPNIDIALDRDNNNSIMLSYNYSYDHSDSDNPLYLLNLLKDWQQPDTHPLGMLPSTEEVLQAIDRDNSSHSVNTKHAHSPRISFFGWKGDNEKGIYNNFNASFQLNLAHELNDYQQGRQVDTLMTRNTTTINGFVGWWHNNSKRGRRIRLSYGFNESAPAITSLLNIRNDSDPLNVTLGNPDLKNTMSHNLNFNYNDKLGKTLLNLSAYANLYTNSIAYGFIYDRETGVRTSKPENVNGNWRAGTSGGVDFPLDKDDRWRLKENVDYSYNCSVDLSGTDETMQATRSVVRSHYLTENLSLRYRPNTKLSFALSGSLLYQNSTSNRESFQRLNVFTFHYGASAQLELPFGFQLSTDLTLYSRRGYSEPSMNTNELVWNARIAKKLMHGNLTLMFDGFDLLGNLSNVRRTINAQGRTETFYNVIPSYGLLHAVYRLNKQPKKKE